MMTVAAIAAGIADEAALEAAVKEVCRLSCHGKNIQLIHYITEKMKERPFSYRAEKRRLPGQRLKKKLSRDIKVPAVKKPVITENTHFEEGRGVPLRPRL